MMNRVNLVTTLAELVKLNPCLWPLDKDGTPQHPGPGYMHGLRMLPTKVLMELLHMWRHLIGLDAELKAWRVAYDARRAEWAQMTSPGPAAFEALEEFRKQHARLNASVEKLRAEQAALFSRTVVAGAMAVARRR